MLDGEAVAEGRDPLVPGPDNLLTKEKIEIRTQSGGEENEEAELSATANFARALFVEYLQTKEANLSMQAFLQDERRIKQMLPEFEDVVYKKITVEDILTTEDISNTRLRQYANEAGRIIEKNSPYMQNEMVIFYRALQTGNPEELQKLEIIASSYETISKELSTMVVPAIFANTHATIVNEFSAFHAIVRSLRNVNIDPLRTMSYMSQYVPRAQSFATAMQNIGRTLTKRGVHITSSDPGYVFIEIYRMLR